MMILVSCMPGCAIWSKKYRVGCHEEREKVGSTSIEHNYAHPLLYFCYQFLEPDQIEVFLKKIEKLKEEEAERKKSRREPVAVTPARSEYASVSD